MIEGLERRRLLAAAVSVVAGKLTVTGTAGADNVSITKTTGGLNVTVDGVTKKYTQSVTSIVMNGNNGDDVLSIEDAVTIKATLSGGAGNDKLRGGGGNDSLNGGAGNDTLDGGKGGDIFTGGGGNDTADYSSRTANVTIGIGSLADDGEKNEHDNIQWDIENLTGGSGNDFLKASTPDNIILGNDGNDTIYGQLGNDLISGGNGDDVINGFGGDDTISGSAGNDNIAGGKGADLLTGGDGNDTIQGGESTGGETTLPDNDLILGGNGDDSLSGGSDNDTIIGGIGDDKIDSGTGNDDVTGEEGADSIDGGDGNDTLDGGFDNDTMSGGLGVDSMLGGDGDDQLNDTGVTPPDDSGNGTGDGLGDLLPAADSTDESAPAFLAGGAGNDTIVTDAGPSILQGDEGDDLLVSGIGNDILDGGLGNDTLEGGDGRDTLTGGSGDDSLMGEAGNDVFVNNDGEADVVNGGPDLDIAQVEESLLDHMIGVEGRYDQPEDQIITDPNDPIGDVPPTTGQISAPQGLGTDPAAAQAPPVVVSGQLKISGATGAGGAAVNDVVQVTQNASTIDVTQNGVSTSFPVGTITSVFVDVGGGNDVVILELSNGGSSLTRPATIAGGSGNDTLRGGSGADLIAGSAGNDSIMGGGGNDTVSGGDGNDVLIGGSPNLPTSDGTDTFQGGAGAGDYADYGFRTNNLTLKLDGVANDGAAGENDSIGSDVEYMLGGRGNDLLVGNANANLLAGGGGSDTLKGEGGNDQLIASYTKDTKIDSVFGNSGYDYLFLEDKVRDDYNASLATDFFRTDINPANGTPLDQLVPDQT